MKKVIYGILALIIGCSFGGGALATEGTEYTAMTGMVTNTMSPTDAQATVETFTGSFSTSIDISTPPGRRNIEPGLKLTYNSRGGSSWVGLGWSLPMASITRSLKHGTPAYDGTDDFQFSGQELVLVDGSTYRLRHESSFMKFEKDETDNMWTATDLNGCKYYFGAAPSAHNITPVRTGDTVSTFNGTFQWYLVEVEDAFENYMVIEYQQPAGTLGYYYPQYMKYTGNRGETESPFYEVKFVLEDRNDYTPAFLLGFTVEVKKRLDKIEMRADSTLISTYDLTYEYSPNSGHSRLIDVQVSAPGETALPSTRYEYYDTPSTLKGWSVMSDVWDTPEPFGYYESHDKRHDYGTRLEDVNGDGLVDVVRAFYLASTQTYYHHVYLNTGMIDSSTLWIRDSDWSDAFASLTKGVGGSQLAFVFKGTNKEWANYPLRLFDINGDALPDLVYSDYAGNDYVYINIYDGDSIGWRDDPNWKVNVPFLEADRGDKGVRFGDLNGDGLPDLVRLQYDKTKYVFINDGNSTWDGDSINGDSTYINNLPSRYFIKFGWQRGFRMLDVNGDGLSDFMWSEVGSAAKLTYLNNGKKDFILMDDYWDAGTFFNEEWENENNSSADLGVRFLDINGDKLLDMLQLTYDCGYDKALIHLIDGSTRWEDQSTAYGVSSLPDFIKCYTADNGDNADRALRTSDVDGDGLTDLILCNAYASGGCATYLNKGSVETDLMIKIDNGQGAVTQVEYKSSHDGVFLGSTACANDDHRLPSVMPVVSSIYTELYDGSTYKDQAQTDYTYCGGYFYAGDTLEGGILDHKTEFRGFGHVEMETFYYDGGTWKAKGRASIRYNQDRDIFDASLVGTVEGQTAYVYDGATPVLVSEVLNYYTVEDIFSGDTIIWYAYSYEQDSWAYDGGTIPTGGKTEYTFDTTNALISKMRSIQEGLTGSSGDEKYTETEYSYYLTNWVQKIERTWMTTELDGATWAETKRLSEKLFYYDGNTTPGTISSKGLLTRVDELLTDVDTSTTPGGTYETTWEAYNGTSSYDAYGNLLEWYDYGVHKKFTYETEVHTYPEVAETDVGGFGHKVRTWYDFELCKAYKSQGPYTGATPAGVITQSDFDGYGRVTDTYITPVGGSAETVAEYEYTIRTCASTGCTSSNWPPVELKKKVYDGDTPTSAMYSVTIYDAGGRVIQEKAEASQVDGTSYQKVVDYAYDTLGRTTWESEPYFVESSEGDTSYETPSTTSAKTWYTYDSRDRMTKTELKYGETTVTLAQVSYAISGNEMVKTVTDAEGEDTKSIQDVYGKVVETVGVLSGNTSISTYYAYDGLDNLVATQVEDGLSILITYDSLGRKIEMDDPDMGEWEYTYDSRGNLRCQIDVGGIEGGDTSTMTCYDYDSINRVKRKFYQMKNGATIEEIDSDYLYFHDRSSNYETGWTHVWYVYDSYSGTTCDPIDGMSITNPGMGLGKLTAVCNLNLDGDTPDDLLYVYGYDTYGRKIEDYTSWDGMVAKMEFGYDRLDRVTSITYPPDGSTVHVLNYDYNNGGELTKVYDNDGNWYALWGSTTGRGYNARGQELQVRYGNSTANAWAYETGTGKLTNLTTFAPGDTTIPTYQDYSYTIDDVGNITEISNELPGNSTWFIEKMEGVTYDGLHRLSGATVTYWWFGNKYEKTLDYGYSNSGNLTSKTLYQGQFITFDMNYNGNQVASGVYDSATLFEKIYDDNGNLFIHEAQPVATGPQTNYLYNTENKLSQTLYRETHSGGWGRNSDVFYHLDGSRFYEGIMDESSPSGQKEGQFAFNDYYHVRINSDGNSYYIFYIFANGRRIAAIQKLVTDTTGWGCSLSTASRLKYITFPALLMNIFILFAPVLIFFLIRGLFFDKSWRGHRLRNTFIIFMAMIFLFTFTPFPTKAQVQESELRLMLWERVTKRLAKMYGDEDRIPPVRRDRDAVPNGTWLKAPTVRDSMLYFVPDRVKKDALDKLDRLEEKAVRWARAILPFKDDSDAVALNTAEKAGANSGADFPGYWLRATGYFLTAWDSLAEAMIETLGPPVAHAEENDWTGEAADADLVHFYHTDHLGSTRIVTDIEGLIFEQIDYGPFGEIINDYVATSNTYDAHRPKYTGQIYDYKTGLYYYGARYYDPQIGRFTQADSIVPRPLDGQTFNRYSYCFNNPFKYVDPSGHNPLEEFCIAFVEAVFVAAVTFACWVLSGFNPAGAVEGFLFASGIVGAIEAARHGENIVKGFVMGVFMAGVTLAFPGLGIANLGYSLYNLVCSNDPDAWGYFIGSLVGGYYYPSNPAEYGYEAPKLTLGIKKFEYSPELLDSNNVDKEGGDLIARTIDNIDDTLEGSNDILLRETQEFLHEARTNNDIVIIGKWDPMYIFMVNITGMIDPNTNPGFYWPTTDKIYILDKWSGNHFILELTFIHEASHYGDFNIDGLEGVFRDPDNPFLEGYLDPDSKNYSRAYDASQRYERIIQEY